MLDVEEITRQTHIDSEHVTREDASEIARADRWTPHVEDGLDAFARAIAEAEAEKWSRVIDKACSDPAFRQTLADDPAQAVAAFGISVPEGVEIRVVENTATMRHLALPPLSGGGAAELSDAEVKALAAGMVDSANPVRMPQTWADTWAADIPMPDTGRPMGQSMASVTNPVRLPQTWADTWKPSVPIPDQGRPY